MPQIQSIQSNGDVVNLYYEDLGTGKNVVFIYGWWRNCKIFFFMVGLG